MVMYVDSRERNVNIINILNENGVQTKIKELPVADYIWNDIMIERKSISDFVSSVSNNHLYDQLNDLVYNLEHNASKAALIMYGNLADLEWRYLKYLTPEIFCKNIGEIFIHYNKVQFFWVPDEEAFAILLSAMYHQSYTRKQEHLPFVKKTKNFKVNTLISTKCFSVAQAKRILKGNSLAKIFDMSLDDMIKIKGLGEVSAKKFLKFRGGK